MKVPYSTLLLVCTGARCNDEKHGSERGEEIRAELKDHNKKLGRKKSVRVCAVSCLDLCEVGPNMISYPDGTLYSGLDRASGRAVYDAATGDGPPRPDLELQPDEVEAAR
jgi:(2Fe-2S) ferredoxin